MIFFGNRSIRRNSKHHALFSNQNPVHEFVSLRKLNTKKEFHMKRTLTVILYKQKRRNHSVTLTISQNFFIRINQNVLFLSKCFFNFGDPQSHVFCDQMLSTHGNYLSYLAFITLRKHLQIKLFTRIRCIRSRLSFSRSSPQLN